MDYNAPDAYLVYHQQEA